MAQTYDSLRRWRYGPGEVPPPRRAKGHRAHYVVMSSCWRCKCGLEAPNFLALEFHLLEVAAAQDLAEGVPL